MRTVLVFLLQTLFLPLRLLSFSYNRLTSLGSVRWVELNLEGKLDEHPPTAGVLAYFKPQPRKFYHLVMLLTSFQQQIKKLRTNEVVVKIHAPKIGWARAWELHHHLKALAGSGVIVRAHLISGDLLSYYIALAASEIYVPPALSLDLLGFAAENYYFRDLFDKLKIKPNFIHIGNFKRAAERFTQKKGSTFARKQLLELLQNMQKQIENSLLESRSLDKKTNLFKIQRQAPLSAQKALSLGLVDGICYYEQLLAQVRGERDWSPGQKPQSADKALRKLQKKSSRLYNLKKMKRLAVVVADGPIIDSPEPNPMAISLKDYQGAFEQIKGARYDSLLLRINSPGGSALVSDLLWQDLMSIGQLGILPYVEPKGEFVTTIIEEPRPKQKKRKKEKKAKQLPIYVSQADVAASGGYYLSAVSKNVFASPLTITGSIGVIGGKLNMAGFAKKMGITIDEVVVGKNGGLYSPFKDFSAEQKRALTETMKNMYALFRNRITLGRGIDDKTLKKLGEGRVYSGEAALDNGLVDFQGGLGAALLQIRNDLGLKNTDRIRVDIYPRIKAPMFSRSALLPSFMNRLRALLALNNESIFFMNDELL